MNVWPASAPAGSPLRPSSTDPYAPLQLGLATVVAFAQPIRTPAALGVPPGLLLAAVTLPLWYRYLRSYFGGRFLFWLMLVCIPFGYFVSQGQSIDHSFNTRVFVNTSISVVGLAFGIGALLWCLTSLGVRTCMVAYGAGLLVSAVTGVNELAETNPLKFSYSIPVAVMLLAVMHGRPFGAQLVAVSGLALVATLIDARSFFAICLLTAALLAWQMRPRSQKRSQSWILTALFVAILGVGVYHVGTTLAVDGYLGTETQQRSLAQIQASGSLILGGRPELGAFAALARDNPWGFGAGTVPNLHDLTVAKTGMAALGYDPNNGYVERYLFGTTFEVHSVVGDTWASFGMVGVLLTASILYLVIRGTALRVALRRASALGALLAIFTLWNLFFSPFYGSIPYLIPTMALALTPVVWKQTSLSDPGS